MTTALLPMLLDLDVKHHMDAFKAECAKVRASLPPEPRPSWMTRGGVGGGYFVTSSGVMVSWPQGQNGAITMTGGGGGSGGGRTPDLRII